MEPDYSKLTNAELQKEYLSLCAKAGDMQYKILCFQVELEKTNCKIRDVNRAAIKLSASVALSTPAAGESNGQ
jgi:hypothetical protein